jgi:hypothetical protein
VPELLLAALDAFMQEHRRCGELDGGVDGDTVWMTCECGAALCHDTTRLPTIPPNGV